MFLFLWYTSITRSALALLISSTVCGQQNETKSWPYETPGEREDWDGKWNPNESEYCELLSSAGSKGLQTSLAPGQRTRGLGIMPNIPGAGRDSFCSTSSSQVLLPLLPSASYCNFTSCSSSHAQTQVNMLELEYFSPRFNLVHLNFCLLQWLPSGSAHSDGVACTAFKALQKRWNVAVALLCRMRSYSGSGRNQSNNTQETGNKEGMSVTCKNRGRFWI